MPEADVGLVYQHAHLAGEFAVAIRAAGDVLVAHALAPLNDDEGVVDTTRR